MDERCKDCPYANYEEINFDPFPWLQGKVYRLVCILDECKEEKGE
jgi:hypothetical protein